MPCICVAACGDCVGFPDAIAVHFQSGEVLQVEHVAHVQVTQDQITLRPANGPDLAFPRSDVYYAGCARCLPPFLS